MNNKENEIKMSQQEKILLPQEENLLVEQIKYLHSEKCSIQTSFLSIISISLGAYGIVLYHAFNIDDPNKINNLFIILPFLFSMSFYNIIKYTIRMLGLGAYISYLEGIINEYHGKALFQWQSYLIGANRFGIAGGIAQIPGYIAICFLLSVKFWENINKGELPVFLKWVFLLLLILEVIALLFLLIVCVREESSIKYWTKEIGSSYNNGKTDFNTKVFFIKHNKKRKDAVP